MWGSRLPLPQCMTLTDGIPIATGMGLDMFRHSTGMRIGMFSHQWDLTGTGIGMFRHHWDSTRIGIDMFRH